MLGTRCAKTSRGGGGVVSMGTVDSQAARDLLMIAKSSSSRTLDTRAAQSKYIPSSDAASCNADASASSQHLLRVTPYRSETHMRERHGVGICRHREELVVTLLVEHPAA